MLAHFDCPRTSNGPIQAICDASDTSSAPPSGSTPDQLHRPLCSKLAASDLDYTPSFVKSHDVVRTAREHE